MVAVDAITIATLVVSGISRSALDNVKQQEPFITRNCHAHPAQDFGAGAGAASGGSAAGGIVAELTGDGRFSSGHQLNAGSEYQHMDGHCVERIGMMGSGHFGTGTRDSRFRWSTAATKQCPPAASLVT